MKIRNGFVTNSSSSSFIVAFKTDENNDLTLELKNLLIDWAKNELYFNKAIKNEQQLKAYFVEYYGDSIDINEYLKFDEIKKDYDKIFENMGKGIYIKDGWSEIKQEYSLKNYFRKHYKSHPSIMQHIFENNPDIVEEYKKLSDKIKNDEKVILFGNKIYSQQNLDDLYADAYYWDEISFKQIMKDEDYKEKYEKLLDLINKGYIITKGTVDCEMGDGEAEMLSRAFKTLSQSDDFIGIDTDMSY